MCCDVAVSQKNCKMYYGNAELNFVESNNYLGIHFQKNGSFTQSVQDRLTKANRAIYMLKQAISTRRNINVKLATNLYDKQIEPIISYGCANWALPASTLYAYLENIPSTVDMSRIKDYLLCNNITISMCKRVGRCNNPTRPILLQFHNFEN